LTPTLLRCRLDYWYFIFASSPFADCFLHYIAISRHYCIIFPIFFFFLFASAIYFRQLPPPLISLFSRWHAASGLRRRFRFSRLSPALAFFSAAAAFRYYAAADIAFFHWFSSLYFHYFIRSSPFHFIIFSLTFSRLFSGQILPICRFSITMISLRLPPLYHWFRRFYSFASFISIGIDIAFRFYAFIFDTLIISRRFLSLAERRHYYDISLLLYYCFRFAAALFALLSASAFFSFFDGFFDFFTLMIFAADLLFRHDFFTIRFHFDWRWCAMPSPLADAAAFFRRWYRHRLHFRFAQRRAAEPPVFLSPIRRFRFFQFLSPFSLRRITPLMSV